MKLFFFLALTLCIQTAHAQKKGQALIDSIVQRLPVLKEDTNQLASLGKIAETYWMIDPAKGIAYAQKALTLAEKLNFKRGIARFNNLVGLLVGDTGNNTQARVYFERSYQVNEALDNSHGMISNLNNIGRSFQRESKYANALDYYFKALAIAERSKDNEQIALVGTNLTASFFAQKNFNKALEYATMTLHSARVSQTPNNIGKALLEIGIIKQTLKDSVTAEKYIDSALAVFEAMGNQSAIVQVLSQKATLAYPDYAKAIVILLKAQKILDKTGPSSLTAIGNLANLGDAYYRVATQSTGNAKNDLLNKSEYYLTRGLAYCKETNNIEYQAGMYLTLSKIQEARAAYRPALENFKLYYSINDSLFSQDKKNELAGLESKYKLELKDTEISLNKLKLVSQQKTVWLLVIGLGLLATIGGLLFWQNRMRTKSNTTLMVLNNQLDEANKIKVKIFGILSHDLRSPISSLANYLHLLNHAPDLLSPADQLSGQQQIGQSTQELLQTLETMLLWSKEQMEHFKPDIKRIPVSRLFDYLQKFFVHAAPVQIRFSDTDQLEVLADENYLQVIMQNLTANAIKSLRDSRGGKIEWKAWTSGGKTMLSIRDNGPGILEEQARNLFTEGQSVNARSGFGFHLIRDLAKAIRYSISIESKPGFGTTFILTAG
ncbi:MAG TPA: tetratricopeptide repeat-containing sensor histidine kinase [Puia sp.]|nr:tetratricopeptide repeat-containing sensor histidine kinase [Puia sp.]